MPTHENEVPLSEAARDGAVQRKSEKPARRFIDTPGVWFLLLMMALILGAAIVYGTVRSDDSTVADDAPQPSPAETTAVPSTAIPTEPPAVAADSSGSSGEDEGEGEGVATLGPISIHADVADGNISSFYQLWPDSAVLVTPRLAGGTFDMTFDFEAMTVSGKFDLAYERSEDEDENGLCVGSPEAFSGTARGAFEDLPIREAQASEWYVEGWIPVELAMSGTAVMGCATVDGDTDFVETPVDGTATPTSWMNMSVDMAMDQGADSSTLAVVSFSTETDESADVKPYWRYRVSLTHTIEQPIRDPAD